METGVTFLAPHKLDLAVHTWDPDWRRRGQKNQASRVSFSYLVSSRPAWAT